MQTLSAQEITQACEKAGLATRPVGVHASLGSFGWVSGGGPAVVRGLLAAGCTVLTPTFSWSAYAIGPPPHLRPLRNGWDYSAHSDSAAGGHISRRALLGMGGPRLYDPTANIIDREMGAIPRAVLETDQRLRNAHPLCSFAAVGPVAPSLIGRADSPRPESDPGLEPPKADDPPGEAVFEPLRNLARLDGDIVLMGVGLNRLTLLHEAERQAGRVLFRRWAYAPHTEGSPSAQSAPPATETHSNPRRLPTKENEPVPAMFAVGGCSEGFEQLAPHLAEIERRLTVGRSVWRIYSARDALAIAAQTIRATPQITRCADADCTRCRDAIRGGPIL